MHANTKIFFNRPHASRRTRTKSSLPAKNNSSIIIFLTGLLVGIIITLLIIFLSKNNMDISYKLSNKKLSPHSHNKVLAPHNINKNTNINTKKPNHTNNYEFYNLLPKMGSSTNKNHYYIQAGTFHTVMEADELKAKLTLQGFETNIETSSIQDKVWYKVLLGPFSSEEIAIVKKRQLDLAGFKNTFIRINEKNEN
jgi:cell division protein FtsN